MSKKIGPKGSKFDICEVHSVNGTFLFLDPAGPTRRYPDPGHGTRRHPAEPGRTRTRGTEPGPGARNPDPGHRTRTRRNPDPGHNPDPGQFSCTSRNCRGHARGISRGGICEDFVGARAMRRWPRGIAWRICQGDARCDLRGIHEGDAGLLLGKIEVRSGGARCALICVSCRRQVRKP